MSHTVYDLNYNWVPKYRKMILRGESAQKLKATFEEISARYEFEIDTTEVLDDHVHLFFYLRLLGILRQRLCRS
jgi:putative transposase